MVNAMTAGRIRRFWPLLLAGALLLVLALGFHKLLTIDVLMAQRASLRQWTGAHPALALPLFIVAYAVVVALALPGAAIVTISGGFLFGWQIGGLASIIGATSGAIILFLAARTALGERLRSRAGGVLEKATAGFHRDAASYLLFLRLAPVFPFFIVNLAAAALRARLLTFIWTTFLGIIPATFAYALAGAGLESVLAAEAAAFDACTAAQKAGCTIAFSPASLLTPPMIAALVALAGIALIPVALRRWRVGPVAQGEPEVNTQREASGP